MNITKRQRKIKKIFRRKKMSRYDKETKFYWLQLKEDFFDEDAMSWLEEQENGERYSLFYLKLCLKSLKAKRNFN